MPYYYNLKCWYPYYDKWSTHLPRDWCYIGDIRYAQNIMEITKHIERLNRMSKSTGSCARWKLYDITPDWYLKVISDISL